MSYLPFNSSTETVVGKNEHLCGAECESVVHVSWERLAYSSSMVKLEEL